MDIIQEIKKRQDKISANTERISKLQQQNMKLREEIRKTAKGRVSMYTIFAFGIDKEKKTVMAHSDDFESLDSVRFAVCQAIAGIDGVAERMRLYCDGIMCVDFELPLGGRIDLANYSCAYIKGYTDCMCDDDEGDTQEAQVQRTR